MGLSDDLKEPRTLEGKTAESHDQQSAKAWTDFYHKDNLVDFYLEKSGYESKTKRQTSESSAQSRKEQDPQKPQAVQSWRKWYESGEKKRPSTPAQPAPAKLTKKEITQAKEIRTRQGVGEEESLAVKTWLEWYESGDVTNSQTPVSKPETVNISPTKKEATQAKEIKTRQGVGTEEALAVKTWLDWYESGDDPANTLPAEKKPDPRPDVRAKEVKSRIGVREEEAMALKAFTDIYDAGDFLDAYLEKSGY